MDINLPIQHPVNNNIQLTIYDKLDADIFKKTSTINTQLNTRLSIHETELNRNRRGIEKAYIQETDGLKREFQKIRIKKPNYVFDDSDISTSKCKKSNANGQQRCLRYCSEFSSNHTFAQHYSLTDGSRVSKFKKTLKEKCKNDFFNMRYRFYFLHVNKSKQTTRLNHNIIEKPTNGEEISITKNEQTFENKVQLTFDGCKGSDSGINRMPSLSEVNDDVFGPNLVTPDDHNKYVLDGITKKYINEKSVALTKSVSANDRQVQQLSPSGHIKKVHKTIIKNVHRT